MLQIHKQAVTEEDAEALLDASYQVRKPFGVPVMFVDPLDYKPRKFLGIPLPRLSMKRDIRAKLQEATLQCDPLCQPSAKEKTSPPMIEDRGYWNASPEDVTGLVAKTLDDYHRYGEDYMAFACPVAAPRISVVLHSRVVDVARVETARALSIEQWGLPPLPGFNAQHHFLSLWHEIAHSVAGSNEAGADLTSAMVYRHVFADHSVLKFQGDLRAAHLVLLHNSRRSTEDYGWSCVEAFDSVAVMKAPPGREEVYAVGCRSYDVPSHTRAGAIRAVGKSLRAAFGQAFMDRDMKPLAAAAEHLVDSGTLSKPDEIMIARRFALAMRRLAIGRDAY